MKTTAKEDLEKAQSILDKFRVDKMSETNSLVLANAYIFLSVAKGLLMLTTPKGVLGFAKRLQSVINDSKTKTDS